MVPWWFNFDPYPPGKGTLKKTQEPFLVVSFKGTPGLIPTFPTGFDFDPPGKGTLNIHQNLWSAGDLTRHTHTHMQGALQQPQLLAVSPCEAQLSRPGRRLLDPIRSDRSVWSAGGPFWSPC